MFRVTARVRTTASAAVDPASCVPTRSVSQISARGPWTHNHYEIKSITTILRRPERLSQLHSTQARNTSTSSKQAEDEIQTTGAENVSEDVPDSVYASARKQILNNGATGISSTSPGSSTLDRRVDSGQQASQSPGFSSQSRKLTALQDLIGYKFRSLKWLAWAINKRDAQHNGQYMADIQQYLALVGDSVLKSTYYAHNFPFSNLHALHGPFANVSSNIALTALMHDTGILDIIRPSLWNGYQSAQPSVWTIATILEAIVGGVYMDSDKNYLLTKPVIENIFRLAGIASEDSSPLDAKNCARREIPPSLRSQILNPLLYAGFFESIPDCYKHLKLNDIVNIQNRFIGLRKKKSKYLGEDPPEDFVLQQEFCELVYRQQDIEQIVQDEKTIVERLKHASLSGLDGGRFDDDALTVGPEDSTWRAQIQEDDSTVTASRVDFLTRNKIQEHDGEHFRSMQKNVQNIIGYEFKDPDLLRMAITYQNSRYNGRNVPKSQDHLALLGKNVIEIAFYQHNLSHATFGIEMQHAFLAISSHPNLALICDATGLAQAVFPDRLDAGLRPDMKNPPSSNKRLANAIQAIIGAVWVDTGSDYNASKAVIEKLLQQEGDEDKAGCPLDWERVLIRPNTWWPRALRRDSPVRNYFADIEEELEHGERPESNLDSVNEPVETDSSPDRSNSPISIETESARRGLVAFIKARWQAADNLGVERTPLDDLITEYNANGWQGIPRIFLVRHAEAVVERTRIEASKRRESEKAIISE